MVNAIPPFATEEEIIPEPPRLHPRQLHDELPSYPIRAKPGRHWDHLRSATPVFIQPTSTLSHWREFTNWRPTISRHGGYGEVTDADRASVKQPDWSKPWRGFSEHHTEKINKRRKRYTLWDYLMKSGHILLLLRLIIFLCAATALALAAAILHYAVNHSTQHAHSTTEMAIVVDGLAMIYTIMVTWDEYTGKPLGLRPAAAKLRLILFDLLFIVLSAINMSLAFEKFTVRDGSKMESMQIGLEVVLILILMAWISTFCVSLLRIIVRLERE